MILQELILWPGIVAGVLKPSVNDMLSSIQILAISTSQSCKFYQKSMALSAEKTLILVLFYISTKGVHGIETKNLTFLDWFFPKNLLLKIVWKPVVTIQSSLLSCSFYLAFHLFGLHCAQKITKYSFLSPEFGGDLMTKGNWTHNLPFRDITTKKSQLGEFFRRKMKIM